MPEPTKIPRPFADSGDKNTIPESGGALGFASWQEGFPAITGTPFAQGGVAPKRADFNGVFNALSSATVWNQQGGVYAYDATTDYEVGNVVEYGGDLYKCLTANGPSSSVKAPTDAISWARIITLFDVAQTATANKIPVADNSSMIGDYIGTCAEGNASWTGRSKTKTKLSNGLMIQTDVLELYTDANGRVSVTFDEAFLHSPVLSFHLWTYHELFVYSQGSATVNITVRTLDGSTVGTGVRVVFGYIAVGDW